MADPKYNFQYCQKLVLLSENWQQVLLAKRYGEADYDGVFSFIGGKMETMDGSILLGLAREKSEEIGVTARVEVYMGATHNALFRKKDGSAMILPHVLGHYLGGEIVLNGEEYSEYQWVDIALLGAFEPKIPNIPEYVQWALQLKRSLAETDYEKL